MDPAAVNELYALFMNHFPGMSSNYKELRSQRIPSFALCFTLSVLLSLPKDCCPQHLSILVNIFVCIWFSKSSWCHPSLLPLDLWQSGALLLTTWSVCCAARLRALEHISKLSVCLLLTGLSFWPQISGESELASSKGGLLTVIYSPHRDKVRHGHCLCTWAFIKRPGWALCRRHSNVQGAD